MAPLQLSTYEMMEFLSLDRLQRWLEFENGMVISVIFLNIKSILLLSILSFLCLKGN